MDAIRYLAALILLSLAVGGAQAQEDLPLFTPVTGTLASGDADQWTFQGADGAMLSLRVQATSGNLDPVLTLTGSTNNVILSNDDYTYPDSEDALLEGITLPRTDTYTVSVSGFGDSAGSYELTLLPGFANLALQETFEDPAQWEANREDAELVLGNNRLALIVSGTEQRSIASPSTGDLWGDYYSYVEIPEITGSQGWQIGLVARQQDAEHYYLYSLNDRGQWRFLVRTDEGDRIIRDWSQHPAIVAGQTAFNLGLLVNDTGFDFFYNGQLVGRLNDSTLTEPGQMGLMAETPSTLGSEVTAQFENLSLTTPVDETFIPQQILTGNSSLMIQELQRRRQVPTQGQMGLVVPESFVTFNRPGVNGLPLGGGETYRTFALGTTFTWEIGTPNQPAGCGLILRDSGDDHYLLAYFDQTGAYGLSQRQGDEFEPGIYGDGLAPAPDVQRLLIIAGEDQLRYYINGQLVGALDSPASSGAIGNAVVNFEPTLTSCQFSDTWIWSWE